MNYTATALAVSATIFATTVSSYVFADQTKPHVRLATTTSTYHSGSFWTTYFLNLKKIPDTKWMSSLLERVSHCEWGKMAMST